jgi:hypothetical protein
MEIMQYCWGSIADGISGSAKGANMCVCMAQKLRRGICREPFLRTSTIRAWSKGSFFIFGASIYLIRFSIYPIYGLESTALWRTLCLKCDWLVKPLLVSGYGSEPFVASIFDAILFESVKREFGSLLTNILWACEKICEDGVFADDQYGFLGELKKDPAILSWLQFVVEGPSICFQLSSAIFDQAPTSCRMNGALLDRFAFCSIEDWCIDI